MEHLIEYPNVPSRTLSKIIYAKYPQLFVDAEAIRGIIRYYRGKRGQRERKIILNKYGKYF